MIIFKMIITLQISGSQLLQVTRHIHCTMLEISPFDLCFYSNKKKKNFSTELILNYSSQNDNL